MKILMNITNFDEPSGIFHENRGFFFQIFKSMYFQQLFVCMSTCEYVRVSANARGVRSPATGVMGCDLPYKSDGNYKCS